MSQKTSKLLARFASKTGRNLDETRKWFDSLSAPERDVAVQHMKSTVGRQAAPPEEKA